MLLDPSGQRNADTWSFIRTQEAVDDHTRQNNVVFCFRRGEQIRYFLCALRLQFTHKNKKVRKILYLNDGLLCSLFSTGHAAGYRAFARRHVALPLGIKSRLLLLLPLVMRAEHLFIAVEQPDETTVRIRENSALEGLDFLFYSNAPGKLLLTRSETFINGTGLVYKTTSSPDYAVSLEREYEAVRSISKNIKHAGSVPDVRERLKTNNACYYPETYLCGKDLRSKLRSAGHSASHFEAIHNLDLLNDWFFTYHASFNGVKKTICSLYAKMFYDFYALNKHSRELVQLGVAAEKMLAEMDTTGHEGLVPVLAHNDLWPGNFIVNNEQLTAIDWERATPDCAPVFDYFWMIISAVLEYRVGQNGFQDYSAAFRQFLSLHDDVCRHARSKLSTFLHFLGLGKETLNCFMLLFLMEWSIQGFRALGAPTAMDQLAQEELLAFVNSYYADGL